MIHASDLMNLILECCPQFEKSWIEHQDHWRDDQERPVGIDVSEFSTYFSENLKRLPLDTVQAIFNLTETCLVEGDLDVQNTMTTQFLENIMNIYSHKRAKFPPSSRFADLLGSKSRAFCRAWDEVTGYKTPGL